MVKTKNSCEMPAVNNNLYPTILSIEELGAEVGGDRQGERVQQHQQEEPCYPVRNDIIIKEGDI